MAAYRFNSKNHALRVAISRAPGTLHAKHMHIRGLALHRHPDGREGTSTRRPGHGTSSENVHVKVKYLLPRVRAIVDHNAVIAQLLLLGHLLPPVSVSATSVFVCMLRRRGGGAPSLC